VSKRPLRRVITVFASSRLREHDSGYAEARTLGAALLPIPAFLTRAASSAMLNG
jgi:hypothetical protein